MHPADRAEPEAKIRHDLQGLRAIAVLGVVVYHLRESWLPGGFAGVDVFFVLSGFFITGLLLREVEGNGKVDLLRFWGRRARRLLPASVLVILTTVVAGYLMTNPLEAHRIGRDGLYSSIFGMNWLSAYRSTLYLQDPNPSPLLHYWSLGVEEQFYVVWPLVLFGLALLWRVTGKHRRARPKTMVAGLATAIGVASFLLASSQTTSSNSYAFFGTFERAWQLALGGLLAVAITGLGRLPSWAAVVLRYAGLAVIVAFYFWTSAGTDYPGSRALIPAFGAALMIAAGAPRSRRDPLTRLLGTRPAQLGGQYSYSWYLWHYPPIVLLPIYLARPLRVDELVLVALGTLALAALTYHLVENPLRSSTRLAFKHGLRSLALGAFLIVLALGGSQATQAAASHDLKTSGIRTASGTLVNPQPAEAADEVPQPYRDAGCAYMGDQPGLAKECRYLPDTGHGDIISVGDSHAAMWFPAVYKLAEDQHWGLREWGRDACPFADITKLFNGPYTQCDTWRTDVVKRLVAARPSLVIVTSLDSVLPPIFMRNAAGKPTKLVGGLQARELWEKGMEKNLRILRNAGIKVLMVDDTPGFPLTMNAPDCVLAHPNDLDACSLPQKEVLAGAPDDKEAARHVGKISTIDFTNVFCHSGRCYQVVGSTLAYRDFDHLTQAMVLRLEPDLERAAVAASGTGVVHPVY